MRLFAALDLDEPAMLAVAEVQAALRATLRSDLRWVLPDQIHLTLCFLGEVPSHQVEAIAASLAKPVPQAPFDLVFAGLGVFPERGALRVLWIGVHEGEAKLGELQGEVARRLRQIGVEADSGPFRPHLTLARFRRSRPGDRRALVKHPSVERRIRQRIDHVTLYESELSSGPPRYRPLVRANLTSI